jgi:hypothetical protein
MSCPHFRSGAKEEEFSMIVMRHKEDNTYSFAIDEFPDMSEDSIEEFWIKKVEKQRKLRDEMLLQLETDVVDHPSEFDTDQVKYTVDDTINILSKQEL